MPLILHGFLLRCISGIRLYAQNLWDGVVTTHVYCWARGVLAAAVNNFEQRGRWTKTMEAIVKK